jgi:predicted RNA methylase
VEVALQNVQEYEVDVDIIIADIQSLNLRQSKPFDTIIMNPPFGTKAKGIDMVFLQQALKVLVSDMYNFVSLILLEYSSVSVYSLHKSSTREVSTIVLN